MTALPLLAPAQVMKWDILWTSDDPLYGGGGTPELESADGWHIPGQAAVALIPKEVNHE